MKLCRIIKKYQGACFGWGVNLTGRGSELPEGEISFLPSAVQLSGNQTPKKVVAGYGETIFLTNDGQLQLCGSQSILSDVFVKPDIPAVLKQFGENEKLTDADIDYSHLVMLTNQGGVYQTNSKTTIENISLPGPAKLIAAGNKFTIAVVLIEGKEEVWGWGESDRNGSVFCQKFMDQREAGPIPLINEALSGDKVTQLSIVGHSIALKTVNGKMLVWGDNATACLGVPRSELSRIDNNVFEPTDPLELAGIEDSVLDFALSQNIMIVRGKKGVYWCGLDNKFALRPVTLPVKSKITGIGASHNHFYIITEEGQTFSNLPLNGEKDLKHYGNEGLYEIDQKYFGSGKVNNISGKYYNAFAICK